MAKKPNPKVKAAFHEVAHNEPKIVAHTRAKFGAERAHQQEVAIALNKARAAGARIPGPNSPLKSEQLKDGYAAHPWNCSCPSCKG